jgi:hypothetical protein
MAILQINFFAKSPEKNRKQAPLWIQTRMSYNLQLTSCTIPLRCQSSTATRVNNTITAAVTFTLFYGCSPCNRCNPGSASLTPCSLLPAHPLDPQRGTYHLHILSIYSAQSAAR